MAAAIKEWNTVPRPLPAACRIALDKDLTNSEREMWADAGKVDQHTRQAGSPETHHQTHAPWDIPPGAAECK
jgi:hypothetical protein